MASGWSYFLLFLTILGSALSITFKLEPDSKKCVKDEVHKDVLVLGNYELSAAPMQRTDLSIVDSQGHTLFKKDDITNGKFSFTTEDYEMFDICFISSTQGHGQGMEREVTLKIQHGGGNAKKYENLAKVEKLKPAEVELKRLEDLAQSLVHDFAYMRSREEQMRDTTESTNSRVLYFGIFSMCCLVFLAGWQLFYLRRYFRSKKLIE